MIAKKLLAKRRPSPKGAANGVSDKKVPTSEFGRLVQGLTQQLNAIKAAEIADEEKVSTTHSGIGRHFIDHCVNNTEEDDVCLDHIPSVEVCFKIMCVSKVLPLDHSFCIDFIVMFDWCDPSVS